MNQKLFISTHLLKEYWSLREELSSLTIFEYLYLKKIGPILSAPLLVSLRKERVLKCTIALKNFPIIFKNFWGTSRNISKNKENMYINQLTILNVAFKFLSNKNIYHRASHPMSHIEIKGLEGCFT